MNGGARISERAQIAKEKGLLTASQFCRLIGGRLTVDELNCLREAGIEEAMPDEWHHSGWNWKSTNFYAAPTPEVKEMLCKMRDLLREEMRKAGDEYKCEPYFCVAVSEAVNEAWCALVDAEAEKA